MDTQSHTTKTVSFIELNGRLDSYTVPNLKLKISEFVDTPSIHLILDLTDVSFIDSRALATIVQGMHMCRATGGDLALASPNESVRRILELTRLDKAIKIFASKAEAEASQED